MTTQEQIDQLKKELEELKNNPLRCPLDLLSEEAIKNCLTSGVDSTARSKTITIGAGGGSADVIKDPSGYVRFKVEKREVWIPFFTT
jgi:hypothetical protein